MANWLTGLGSGLQRAAGLPMAIAQMQYERQQAEQERRESERRFNEQMAVQQGWLTRANEQDKATQERQGRIDTENRRNTLWERIQPGQSVDAATSAALGPELSRIMQYTPQFEGLTTPQPEGAGKFSKVPTLGDQFDALRVAAALRAQQMAPELEERTRQKDEAEIARIKAQEAASRALAHQRMQPPASGGGGGGDTWKDYNTRLNAITARGRDLVTIAQRMKWGIDATPESKQQAEQYEQLGLQMLNTPEQFLPAPVQQGLGIGDAEDRAWMTLGVDPSAAGSADLEQLANDPSIDTDPEKAAALDLLIRIYYEQE